MSNHASRVIIVSDDSAVLEVCQPVHRQADVAMHTVPTVSAALELVRDDLFDLVLLDLQASASDDLHPLIQIRECNGNIPVVILTGMASLEHVAQATRMGAQGVLLKPFSPTELRNTIANVLQRRQALRTQNRVDALRPLVQITERLLAELDLPRLYDLIIDTVRVELKADRASLMLLDENGKTLEIAACSGLPAEVYVGQRVEVAGSLAGWVAMHGMPLLVNGQQGAVAEVQHALTNDQLASTLCVPLMAGGRARGVLNAAKTNLAGLSFTEADQELLVLLAGQAAIAIENARLYNLAQRRADRLALLYNMSTAVTGSLDLEQIIATTLRYVSAALGTDHGYLFLAAGEPLCLVQYVTLNYGTLSALTPIDLPANRGIIGQVLLDGTPRMVPVREWKPVDAQRFPPWEGIIPTDTVAAAETVARSDNLAPLHYPFDPVPYWLCVALVSEHGICGAIELLGQPGQQFGEDDIQLMTALATPVAMAIEKARLHASVAESEARYRALLHHATEAVLLLDADKQRILDINMAAERLSGYEREALLQMNPSDLLPGVWEIGAGAWAWGDAVRDVGAAMRVPTATATTFPNGGGAYVVPSAANSAANNVKDALLYTKDGRTVPVSVSVSGVPYAGQQLLLVMVRDISERQRIANQLLQTEKLAAVGRLSASIAHEINNPLQAIHNSLHLLNNRPLTEDKRQFYLSKAQEEVDRLIGIVQRMLDFYRPSRDGVGMRLTDLHDLLESVLALTEKQLQSSQVQLVRDWVTKLPLVYAIGNHLKQVYLNLILNAIESMPDGGVLTVRTYATTDAKSQEGMSLEPTSTVGSAGNGLGPAAVVEFIDSGQGISPDILPKIFEPFYTTRSTGTGLGLAISYSIIEQHHGELSVSSVVGQGTTFRIRLPIATG